MSLARVKYCFADLLSVLESGRDDKGFTFAPLVADEEVSLPPNLFFVGTVNVDETTHAFSPKVLDRAFTIELGDIDFTGYPGDSKATLDVSDEVRATVAAILSRDGAWTRVTKEDVGQCIATYPFVREHLSSLNAALTPFLLNFGYRVFDEVAEFTLLASTNGLFDPNPLLAARQAFDSAVLMKVLPKFNGSRQRLEEPLRMLLGWCTSPSNPQAGLDAIEGADVAYPRTYARAGRMISELARDGFTSFG